MRQSFTENTETKDFLKSLVVRKFEGGTSVNCEKDNP